MRKLMKHQEEALAFVKEHKGCAGIFMAPGTGKTLVAIRYALKAAPASRSLKLVICRRDDYLTWKQELQLEEVSLNEIAFIESGKVFRSLRYGVVCPWTIITYDLARRFSDHIKRAPFRIVTADESHMIKRWKALRTKTIIECTRHIPRRIPMTGTPITNDPEDVFTQCLFADNGRLFGNNLWRFKNTYYLRSGPGWYLKHGAKSRIKQRLKSLAFCVHEDDVLTLPPKRNLIKAVPMSGLQRRHYREVLENWEIELDRETIELDYVISQLAKLRQIASGFVYDKNHNSRWLNSSKLKLLSELLTEVDYLASKPKVVIWCAHTAEIDKIEQLAMNLNIKAVRFSGGNRRKKDEARIQFRDDKRTKLFIGQVDSGMGMNELVVSDTAVYFSNSFKVVSRQQSLRRIRRKGSDRHRIITYWDLVTENSIDEHILKSLSQSISIADYILSRIREGEKVSQILK